MLAWTCRSKRLTPSGIGGGPREGAIVVKSAIRLGKFNKVCAYAHLIKVFLWLLIISFFFSFFFLLFMFTEFNRTMDLDLSQILT